MSLVKWNDERLCSSWTSRDKHATRHQIPHDVVKPALDYEKLRSLCTIDGLKNRENDASSGSAHRQFMAEYRSVFVEPRKKSRLPTQDTSKREPSHASALSLISGAGTVANTKSVVATEASLSHKPSKLKPGSPEPSHDVRDYLPLLHQQRRSEDPKAVLAGRIKTLRRLLRKLPFERTASENDRIYNAVKHFSSLAGQVAPHVLKELCVVAQLDSWKDDNITVFGNTGLHLVLRGTVRPYNHPYMKHRGVQLEFRSPTPEPPLDMPVVGVGECFGTLEKVEGRDPNSRILTVTTLETNCDFMKISTSDYQRISAQIRMREQTEKINLMQACSTYRLWSKQPLIKVADLFMWVTYPPNTVLVSEGFRSPFIAIIKSGECHVLRQVDVQHQLPNGRKEKRRKQVVMGKLHSGDSFGEVSVIGEEEMTCSIITASDVELVSIEPGALHGLDDVTLQLLLQSSERTYANLTKDDIHSEYIQQEMRREWNEFKHNMVVDAINKKGIRPGYGKWTKA